ncbi:MAG TPA: hypothetical protein VEW03_16165, partial [Longimicrobiaceae bacterium]|nr:hypothetical protein [Longimicrobiaceae bacterium]
LVDTVESLFRGNAKDLIAEREQAAAARGAEESSRTRVTLAARLVDLQQQVATGADSATITGRIRDLVSSLTPEATEADRSERLAAPAQPIALPAAGETTPEAPVPEPAG